MYVKFTVRVVTPTYFSRLCLFKVHVGACPPLFSSEESCTSATVAGFIYKSSLGGAVIPTFSGRLCLFRVLVGDCPSPLLW
jgi:hypothetical protein